MDTPREKYERVGIQGLQLSELVALLLGAGVKGQSVFVMGEHVANLLLGTKDVTLEQLVRLDGIGKTKGKIVLAAVEIGKMLYKKDVLHIPIISSPQDVLRECRELLTEPKEHVCCLYLNGANEILKKSIISIGTANESLLHPREVFSEAISLSATGVILVHNHPSGNPEPSRADREVTKRMVEAGKLLGIEILDHIIIARCGWKSVIEME